MIRSLFVGSLFANLLVCLVACEKNNTINQNIGAGGNDAAGAQGSEQGGASQSGSGGSSTAGSGGTLAAGGAGASGGGASGASATGGVGGSGGTSPLPVLRVGTPHLVKTIGTKTEGLDDKDARCPDGYIVEDQTVWAFNQNQFGSGIDVTCGRPTISKEAPYKVSLEDSIGPLSMKGSSSQEANAMPCGTGLSSPTEFIYAYGSEPSKGYTMVGKMGISCASFIAKSQGSSVELQKLDGPTFEKGSLFGNVNLVEQGKISCPEGEVLTGYSGAVGSIVNTISIWCAPLTVDFE
jgi:hypothetical protein